MSRWLRPGNFQAFAENLQAKFFDEIEINNSKFLKNRAIARFNSSETYFHFTEIDGLYWRFSEIKIFC